MPEKFRIYTYAVVAAVLAFVFSAITDAIGQDAGVMAPYKGSVVKEVDATTLDGKVMCGYQGWFGSPGDGSPESDWRHWTKHKGSFSDNNAKVDLWPDVSELTSAERGVTYVLMVQRPDSGNSDASEIRRVFQQTAADALPEYLQDH